MKAAAQVGLFVIVAVVLFIGAVIVVGRNLPGEKLDRYSVVMPDAGGLAKGSRVLMAGVQVGDVTDVAIDTPTQAKLTISLKHATRLPLATRALIAGSLVGLGDTPLTLVQDPKIRAVGDFEPGMTILGGKAGPFDAILPDGGTELYGQLNETLRAVRKLLENNGLQKDVRAVLATTKGTMETSQDTLRAFTRLANQSEALLASNRGQIAAILKSTEATLVSVQGTAQSIERFAKSGKLQNGAEGLIADAHKIAAQSEALIEDLRRTLNDPQLNADLRAAADNAAKTSEKFPALVEKADKIAANVERLTTSSQDLPKKLGDVLDGATELEKKLGGLTDKFGGVLGKKPKSLPPVTTQVDLIHESDPGHWRTDLNLTVPLSGGFVAAGLWDAFERDRVNLQLGRTVSPSLDYRYGIYAGRPGVGVDYLFTPRLGLRGDLWDFNDTRFDARLRYEFGGGLIGWLGMDRLFEHPRLTVGVGVRR